MNTGFTQEFASRLTSSLAKHHLFNQYFQSTDDFLTLTAFEAGEIEKLLTSREEDLSARYEAIGENIYRRFQVPFQDVVEFLRQASSDLATSAANQQIPLSNKKQASLNKTIQNAVARSYFYLSLQDMKLMADNMMEDEGSPLAIHFSWLSELITHLANMEKPVPEQDHLACNFAHWLGSMQYELYLSSLGDKRLAHQARIFLTHRKIHQQMAYVISFKKVNNYSLAYSHLLEMYYSILELEQHIRILQLNYLDREEANFYSYIESKSSSENELFYFVSVNMLNLPKLPTSEAMAHDESELRKEIRECLRHSGLDGVLYTAGNEIRFFIKNEIEKDDDDASHFIQHSLKPFIEKYELRRNVKMRSIGINLNNLVKYHKHKIAILKQLPKHQTNQKFKVITPAEADTLYQQAVSAQEAEQFANLALDQGLLELFFQPIISPNEVGRIYVEALVRAPKSDGHISAEDFLGYIEKNDRMLALDMFVLQKMNGYLPELAKVADKVSVNVYPSSFRDETLTGEIIALKKRSAEHGIKLIVEITEQLFLTDTSIVEELARKHGIAFSLDDFGSGYSNLVQLIELAKHGVLEVLKIDGSLVRGVDKDEKILSVIQTTTQFANTLGLTPVVMEYVESLEILEKLETLDANLFYQGYFFDRALPIHELVEKYQPVEGQSALQTPVQTRSA